MLVSLSHLSVLAELKLTGLKIDPATIDRAHLQPFFRVRSLTLGYINHNNQTIAFDMTSGLFPNLQQLSLRFGDKVSNYCI